jgi:hypothetical protein
MAYCIIRIGYCKQLDLWFRRSAVFSRFTHLVGETGFLDREIETLRIFLLVLSIRRYSFLIRRYLLLMVVLLLRLMVALPLRLMMVLPLLRGRLPFLIFASNTKTILLL